MPEFNTSQDLRQILIIPCQTAIFVSIAQGHQRCAR